MSVGAMLPGLRDPQEGRWVLLDGKPGQIVRAYAPCGDEPGYDVDMLDGTQRWCSHLGAARRMDDLTHCPRCNAPLLAGRCPDEGGCNTKDASPTLPQAPTAEPKEST